MFQRLFSDRLQRLAAIFLVALAFAGASSSHAQSRARVTAAVDETKLATLKGHLAPQVQTATDLGAIDTSQPVGRMMLVLQRSDEQETALKSFLEQAHQSGSANYHQWLTPSSFGAQYGVADSDIQKMTTWLQSHGLTVAGVSKSKMTIEFSGTVGQVSEALHTSFHNYKVAGEIAYSVTSEPQIPAAFANVVAGVTNLTSLNKPKPSATVMGQTLYNQKTHTGTPQWTVPGGFNSTTPLYFLTPEDFATQYDVKPAYAAGLTGAGQTIAIVEEANIDITLANNYRKLFGLPFNPPQIILDGNDPGITSASVESYLDVENAGAIAPNATIKMYVAGGVGLSGAGYLTYAIARAVDDDAAPVISVSFSSPEYIGTANNAFYSTAWEQAAAQGQTVLVSTGDSGVAGPYGLAVNGIASNAWAVAVGGTDFYFSDYATGGASIASYWSTTNDASYGSLLNPMAEQPWNGSQFGLNSITYDPVSSQITQNIGGGGGASYCAIGTGTLSSTTHEPICTSGWPKPTWQAGTGVPTDGVRDIPDVSLFASNAINGVIWPICQVEGDCAPNAANGNRLYVSAAGGTSASAPAMAAIMSLINQKYGPQGQANYVLYPLAAQYPSSFHNISIGSINEPCNKGAYECSLDANDSYYSYQVYYAHAGYNQAVGLGSVDVNQLITNWPKVSLKPTTTSLVLTPTTITHGQSVVAAVSVQGSGTPTGNVSLVANTALPNASGIGFLTLSGGTASATLNTLPGGTYTIYANYGGDGVNAPSKSAGVSMIVAPEASKATLTAYTHSSAFYPTIVVMPSGGTVREDYGPVFDVQISNAAGVVDAPATGTVTYTLNGAVVGIQQVNANATAEWIGNYLPAGSYTLTATYSGDTSFLPSSVGTFTFTVIQTPNVSVAFFPDPSCTNSKSGYTCKAGTNVTLTGVVPMFASFTATPPTGTITFTLGSNAPITVPLGTNVSQYVEGSASVVAVIAPVSFTNLQSTASLTGGYETLTGVYSGDANYGPATGTVKITVTPTTLLPSITTIALASPSSSTAVLPGTLVTLNATVTGNGTIAPTGTVSAHDGYALSFTPVTLVPGTNGTSTASISFREEQLPSGDNFLTFAYSGDTNYLPGSSTAIDLPNLYADFTLITTTPSVNVTSGSSTLVPVTVLSQYNFSGAVALTCTAPTGLTCSLATSSLTSSPAGANTTISISTITTKASLEHGRMGWRLTAVPAFAGLLLLCIPVAKRRRFGSLLGVLLGCAVLVGISGCGSSAPLNSTPVYSYAGAGNYTVTVTGTSSSGTHNLPITVTVH